MKRLLLMFLAFSLNSFAIIYKIESIKEAEKELLSLTGKNLAIFDIDDTIIIHNDSILRPCGELKLAWAMLKNFSDLRGANFAQLYSIVTAEAKERLLEQRTAQLIKELQNQKVKTIALTASNTGRVGILKSVEDSRIALLKSLGVDFDHPFSTNDLVFNELKRKKGAPTYKQGIIFSSDAGKGKALLAFLDRVNFKPKKVLMVDDKIKNLIDVEKALLSRGITFIGYEYTKAKTAPCTATDEEINLQLLVLKKEKRWIDESEAKKLLLEGVK